MLLLSDKLIMDQCHHADVSRDVYCGMMSWRKSEDKHCVKFYVIISFSNFILTQWLYRFH